MRGTLPAPLLRERSTAGERCRRIGPRGWDGVGRGASAEVVSATTIKVRRAVLVALPPTGHTRTMAVLGVCLWVVCVGRVEVGNTQKK